MYKDGTFSIRGTFMCSLMIPLLRLHNIRHANVSLLKFYGVTESTSRLPVGLPTLENIRALYKLEGK